MIDALIGGKLHAKPELRTSHSGREFVTGKLIAAAAEGQSHFVNVVAFSAEAKRVLLALDAGDSVAVAGPLKVEVYTRDGGEAKPSMSIVAQAALSAYAVRDKRRRTVATEEPGR